MPHIRVTVTGPSLPAPVRRTLAQGLTRLAVSALGKSGARTTVHLDLPSADCYFVDGTPLADGVRDAHVEVSVTAGTNSAEEKAAFIAGAAELLADLVGPPARGGVALHELHPESYGYQGVTQFAYYRQN
ncbi:hypothetical protein DCW30_13105 [Streptomyces alfalfae]|uniref:4-oxalocrotonate tautomerase-like domain-containing protein n=1 Tax=Streptomyces alfalfae TaxID=1642299 RepID=A0ABM6GRA3_9ACTN|nr:tautomerase family protein [Streptomyces alfalfae]AYA16563.1 hypothetical protein D3X13_10320 [Streptomyces fradiae]APY86182.1 hypothetical protein A7J05_11120 [Streptomyces alfalfae]QUI34056.1 tautomerase family protein [Streptomyces alfalfae]RXX44310.1 hypothetical protein DCW30_13105 [Streptomyces alfalfae]RZN00655.1 hypothetical protein D4104_08760 [Streptomyces alfalfae]